MTSSIFSKLLTRDIPELAHEVMHGIFLLHSTSVLSSTLVIAVLHVAFGIACKKCSTFRNRIHNTISPPQYICFTSNVTFPFLYDLDFWPHPWPWPSIFQCQCGIVSQEAKTPKLTFDWNNNPNWKFGFICNWLHSKGLCCLGLILKILKYSLFQINVNCVDATKIVYSCLSKCILYSQCRWPSYTYSLGFSSHAVDLVLMNHSGLTTILCVK